MSTPDPIDLPPFLAPVEEPFTDHDFLTALEEPAAADAFPTVARAAAYEIPDDGQADWALRKLAQAKAERADLDAQRAAYLAPIDAWYQRQLAASGIEKRIARWEALLADYAIRRREATREATAWFPAGSLSTTASKARPKIEDPEAVLGWASALYSADEDADELAAVVKVTEEPMIGEIRKRVQLAERPVSESITWTLECGHEVTDTGFDLSPEDEPRQPATDFTIPCHACGDPIEGVPERAVVDATVEIVTRTVVVDAAGEEVPGLGIEPAKVTAKANPGARR